MSFDAGPMTAKSTLSPEKLEELYQTAAGFVAAGDVPSIQVAVAQGNRIVGTRAFGTVHTDSGERAAGDDTLYVGYSTTKAVTAAAAWLLIQDNKLGTDEPVADIVHEFGTHGKDRVLVENLFTHTAGFPEAPFDVMDWNDAEKRLARFAQWRLDFEPGTKFQYHTTSTMWILAEVISRRAGMPYQEFIRTHIAQPLGLTGLHVGLPPELNSRMANVENVGTRMSDEDMQALGIKLPFDPKTYEAYLEKFNRADFRAVGAPGSGGIFNAASLAMFYQALLNGGHSADGTQVWKPETIDMALRIRTGDFKDPVTGKLANRALGMVISGDDERIYRTFAYANSPRAFGHPGVGGQVAWADPETGISFVSLTNGLERNPMQLGMRGMSLSGCAAG